MKKKHTTITLDSPRAIIDIAREINFLDGACAALVNGQLRDLRDIVSGEVELKILSFDDEQGASAYRHTAAHVLAQAVKRLFPSAKLAIGPAIEEGFYYDIDHAPFSSEDIKEIDKQMQIIISEDIPLERFSLSREKAKALMAAEPYKLELIDELPEGETITFYRQGDFTDLCAGVHLPSTGCLGAVRLSASSGSSGAYWRGDENRAMLSRIYGTAFPTQAQLEAYLEERAQALLNDHNRLGRELRYFTTSDIIGQGLPLLMPKGAKVIQLLQRFVEDEEERRGYVFTKTPMFAKSDLYKTSGHWHKYRDKLFIMGDDKAEDEALAQGQTPAAEVFALRPMTCPFQFLIFNAHTHSYRELPIRYGETSTLFRNESSGEMHGLIRVRQFTISEGHLICTEEQLEDEFLGALELAMFMMRALGLDSELSYQFSMYDPQNREKYIGSDEQWGAAQGKMRQILNRLGLEYTEAVGEAAFYGPKLDIDARNVHGKKDTIVTIQIDFALGELWGMTYDDKDGEKKHPVIIHRTSIGCYERTLAMLIEKYSGAMPTWLSPTQAIVLPISDKFMGYAEDVYQALQTAGIRTSIDRRAEKLGAKIRYARNERIPYILVVGEKEAETGTAAVRSRRGDEGPISVEDIIRRISHANYTRELD